MLREFDIKGIHTISLGRASGATTACPSGIVLANKSLATSELTTECFPLFAHNRAPAFRASEDVTSTLVGPGIAYLDLLRVDQILDDTTIESSYNEHRE